MHHRSHSACLHWNTFKITIQCEETIQTTQSCIVLNDRRIPESKIYQEREVQWGETKTWEESTFWVLGRQCCNRCRIGYRSDTHDWTEMREWEHIGVKFTTTGNWRWSLMEELMGCVFYQNNDQQLQHHSNYIVVCFSSPAYLWSVTEHVCSWHFTVALLNSDITACSLLSENDDMIMLGGMIFSPLENDSASTAENKLYFHRVLYFPLYCLMQKHGQWAGWFNWSDLCEFIQNPVPAGNLTLLCQWKYTTQWNPMGVKCNFWQCKHGPIPVNLLLTLRM